MARVWASLGFDQRSLDLSNMFYNAWQFGLLDNSYLPWNGRTYEDAYVVDWSLGSTYYGSVFGGYGMSVDGFDRVTGGVVTGYVETYYNGNAYVPYLSIEGISASALGLYNAAGTFNTSDEYAIINAELAGADKFDLSPYADFASGLGGNDTLNGNGGADTLLGGNGNDRIVGGTGRDQLYGQAGSDQFVFTRTNEMGTSTSTSDLVLDFAKGYDKISLSGIDAFAPSAGTNDAFVFRGTGGFTSTTRGEVRFQKVDQPGTTSDYTMVYIDTDGDPVIEAAIRLTGLYNLVATDFIL